MPRETRFSADWLSSTDGNGDTISQWCEGVRDDPFSAKCTVCCKTFSIANMGIGQLQAHCQGKKHQTAMTGRKGQTVFNLPAPVCDSNAGSTSHQNMLTLSKVKGSHWLPVGLDDKTRRAEALLVMQLAASNYSYSSYDNIADVCKAAFSDSEIAQNLKMNKKKASYTISDGLGPYFQNVFHTDLKSGRVPYFTLYFDETTTRQVKKQMDIHIGYWSERFGRVIVVYVDSAFLGHAEASHIEDEILQYIDRNNVKLENLLQCSMDGPAVNNAFLLKLNARLQSQKLPPLVDLGTCSLHPVHTAFRKAVEALPFDVEQFATDIYQWFKMSSARREDYQMVQKELLDLEQCVGEFFLKPISSRWLYLEPVCSRIIEQFDALKTYFLTNLRRTGMIPSSLVRYNRIKQCLEDKMTPVYLHFVVYIATTLTPFMKLFQKDEPLVHILYDKANEVMRTCLRMFLKAEVVGEKEGAELHAIDCDKGDNWLQGRDMEIGSGTKRTLAILPDDRKKTIRLDMRKSLKVMGKYLQDHLPLKNAVLRDLQSLHPLARKADAGRSCIGRLCNHLQKVTKTDQYCDHVCAEWLLYSTDTALDSQPDTLNAGRDICDYWQHVSTIVDTAGEKKYEHLSYIAKAALTLSHGNAAPERGFSVNNALVTQEKGSLAERSIVALRVVKEAIRLFGSSTNVPMTKELLQSVKRAHAEYALFLENERKRQVLEEEERKKKQEADETQRIKQKAKNALLEQLKEQDRLEESQLQEQDTARELISEASRKLTEALQGTGKDIQSAKVAQVMLTAGNDKLNAAAKQLADIKQQKEKIQEKLRKHEITKNTNNEVSNTSAPAAKRRKLH